MLLQKKSDDYLLNSIYIPKQAIQTRQENRAEAREEKREEDLYIGSPI